LPPTQARALAFLLALTLPSLALAQAAETRRLVLVSVDAELSGAVSTSLAPWGVELVSIDGDAPASMPLAADRGRDIAAREHADAVVWISISDAGPALWVYDADADRSLSRGLTSAPPYDEPTAAAVALTLKTLLRHSLVAPVAERAVVPEPARAAPRFVHLEIGGGVGAFATSPSDVEPRASLAASLWPGELEGIVGFSLSARSGPGISIRAEDATGRWTSTLLALGVRLRGELGLFDLGVGLEAGAAITTLDAQLALAQPAHVLRLDFGRAGWGEVGIRPDAGLRIAIRAGATVSLPFERYVQRGALVLDVSPVALLAELLVGLSFS
jgi:hypothetical protein